MSIELEDAGFKAKVVLASVGPNGVPIYSIEATYPRFIHSELLTHRDRARNSASSRAIPWKRKAKDQKRISDMAKGSYVIGKGKFAEISLDSEETYDFYVPNCMFSMVMTNPVVPISFGLEQKGMQSGDELTGIERDKAIDIWLEARNAAVGYADRLAALGVHKSICNRLTEAFMWITTLFTATEWNNFFRLRCHPAAEKHFQKIASMMKEVKRNAVPRALANGDWHLPYVTRMNDTNEYWCGREGNEIMNAVHDNRIPITDDERLGLNWAKIQTDRLKLISAGRCARLSYLTHDGVRDFNEDIRLAKTLIERSDDVIHASALEHTNQAVPSSAYRSGPMRGWKQFRKEFDNENVEG